MKNFETINTINTENDNKVIKEPRSKPFKNDGNGDEIAIIKEVKAMPIAVK
jgi:hypothetical protein